MRGIRAVLFDLDGTLRYNVPGALEAIHAFARELGVPVCDDCLPAATRWSHAYWASSEALAADVARFGELNADFWINFTARFLMALGCPPNVARQAAPQVRCRFEQFWQPEDRLMPGAAETLAALRQRGLTLGVVTNRRQAVDAYLHDLGLADLLDYILAAGEIEIWKPHPDIFRHALEQIAIPPSQALYVGDNYYADVVGARQAGLQAVLFDRHGYFSDMPCPVVRQLEDVVRLLTPAGTAEAGVLS